eukprot:g26364.t1
MTLALAETGSHGFLFGLLMETFISIFTAANLLAMQTAVSAGCRPIISAAGGLVATCVAGLLGLGLLAARDLCSDVVVEHLKESEYQVKGGEDVIFGLLDLRWPEKDRTDEIGEHISDVFNLKSKDGETIRQWCARARECFDRCARKTGVDFPAEARGWVLLNASGLSEENRAVVLARAQGNLKFDEMSQAMRSVFPDYVISKRRVTAAHVVEDPQEPEHPDEDFADVELFLAEHGHDGYPAPDEDEGFDEAEAAEVLAATWRERRAELNQVMLVSSPGYAILDSGCGKTIIGRETLTSFREIWDKLNIPVKPEFKQRNVFRYGNGQQEVSDTMIDMPIFLAGKPGYVRAAIVQGSAPLLLSRPSMKKLKVQMNFAEDSIQLFDSQESAEAFDLLSFNTVVGIYLLVAQCLLLMAYSWDFTKRIKALTSIGVATDPDWASPLTGRSARCFCWILAGNQWLWWMVLTLVKRHHQLCSWYFGLCDNHLTWTALLVACVLLLFVPFWVMFAIQHGDQEHEFGQTRYLFSHAVSTLCSFTMSSFLVAQQTLVQAGCNPRVCEAFLGLLTVVLLVLRPWHLPRVLRRMEFNVFFTFGFLWSLDR